MGRFSFLGFVVTALLASGCQCTSSGCDRAVCGPCRDAITIDVTLAGPEAPVTVSGDDAGITCAAVSSGEWRCQSVTATPGRYRIVLSAAGHVDQSLDITLAAPSPAVCCACPGFFDMDVTLAPPGFGDAGPRDAGRDASTDAGGLDAGDAGDLDADLDAPPFDADLDAPPVDGGTCDPSAIRFVPSGGTLEEGALCDDVFVCLETEADGALVMAASSAFTCSSVPDGSCPGATCRYADPGGPSTLDANELAEICAVTVALPSPDLVCMVYL